MSTTTTAALTLTNNSSNDEADGAAAVSFTTNNKNNNNSMTPKSRSSDETTTLLRHQSYNHNMSTTSDPLDGDDDDNDYDDEYGQHYEVALDKDDADDTTSTLQQNAAPFLQVPDEHGLLMRLDSGDGSVTLEAVLDRHYPAVHPHCYAPASLSQVQLLHGGGSGTAVFGGVHPQLHRIVMKHGNSKDTGEVMALATIANELYQRQRLLSTTAAATASRNMKARIPEFVMVYISRHHLRERTQELWNFLRTITYTLSGRRLSLIAAANNNSLGRRTLSHNDLSQLAAETTTTRSTTNTNSTNNNKNNSNDRNDDESNDNNEEYNNIIIKNKRNRAGSVCLPPPEIVIQSERQELRAARALRVEREEGRNNRAAATMNVLKDSDEVEIRVPGCDDHGRIAAGVPFLQDFQQALMEQQDRHNWKVTLAQKWIGAGAADSDTDTDNTTAVATADNGADVLTSGRLLGTLLETLIHEFTAIMQDLDTLTLPEERQGVFERVRHEVVELEEIGDVRAVSQEADYFVGRAVLKNFHPGHGRFRNLRLLGDDFRVGDFFLTDRERPAAGILARLLQRGAALDEIFVDAPDAVSALDRMEDRGWLDILQHAVQFNDNCPSATECIWTCGLTDAGLHNTFLSADRGLEVFDLGEPGLEPRPAFLTKFLMSFFHTLGMEDDDGGSSWKTRFDVVETDGTKRLSLTAETEEKVPYIENVFTTTLDHFIEHIFDRNESVRQLLIKYVILQLLSDASFCLRRWESKGGGSKRYGERLQYPMEKWLWRSVWDQYIACYVYAHLLNE